MFSRNLNLMLHDTFLTIQQAFDEVIRVDRNFSLILHDIKQAYDEKVSNVKCVIPLYCIEFFLPQLEPHATRHQATLRRKGPARRKRRRLYHI